MASLWMLCFLIHSPNHVGWGHSDRFAVGFEICTLDMREFSYSMFYGCWMVTAMGTTFYFYYCIYKLLKTSKLSRKMITKENSVAPSRLQCAWVSSADFGTTAKNSPLKAGDFGPVINKKKSVGPLENATEIRNEIRLIKTSFKIFLLFVVLWTPTNGFWDVVKRVTGCVGRCEVDAVGARFSKNQRLANHKNLMKP
uniref:Uncharacterized protein n=1 Tax=Romanomermis culicivorax TaxID=13658 RepID=A0A915IIN8_ROMCU